MKDSKDISIDKFTKLKIKIGGLLKSLEFNKSTYQLKSFIFYEISELLKILILDKFKILKKLFLININ